MADSMGVVIATTSIKTLIQLSANKGD